jgi:hypothetical protein
MQNRFTAAFLLCAMFLLGGAAALSLIGPKPVLPSAPAIFVVHTPPQVTLRGQGWALTLPTPNDGARDECIQHDDCDATDGYDGDDSGVISI